MNSLFNKFFCSNEQEKTETEEKKDPLFQLPIEYLDPSTLYPLQPTIAADLELVATITEDQKTACLYDNLFLPKHEFAEKTVKRWQHHITTNTDFLKETQQIIGSLGNYQASVLQNPYDLSCSEITSIWNDIKEDPDFLERYSYMELAFLKGANTIPAFLQAVSIINMSSPILSFFIPFVMFFMPFILIKIQGHPITFEIYLSVLKDISRHHLIGKIISTAGNFHFQNLVYLLAIIGLYIFQMYQNWLSCNRFYQNIHKINTNISVLKEYLQYSIRSMSAFSDIIASKPTYATFMTKLQSRIMDLKRLSVLLSSIEPFSPSFSKISEIGNLLSCYYQIYSIPEYYESLAYSFEFEGYINNLLGIYENLSANRVAFATYYAANESEDSKGKPKKLVIQDQYYPALKEDYVVNDVDLEKNMTITGPNAAGKTTYLKTTAINIIFSQQVGCGFYSTCSLCPYTHIHSYLNIPDTSGRDSLFQAESRRCKEIIAAIIQTKDIENRHFCIFDELYSGTNPGEANKSAYAFLRYLAQYSNVDFILTTHYIDMCKRIDAEKSETIENWKMDVVINENGDLDYQYTISKGISDIQGAIKVLQNMEYPSEIIDTIKKYDDCIT